MPFLETLRSEDREPYSGEKFWADLKAGMIGFAAALPVTMALGVVSGMGPVAGLHCFIIVGLVAALLGGARMLVCGPSVAIAVIVATILADNGGDLVQLAMDDIAIVGVSLAVMLLWPKTVERYAPGPLAGVGSGILLSVFLPGAALLGDLPTGLPVPVISIPSIGSLGGALHSAILLALISTAYTLLLGNWSPLASPTSPPVSSARCPGPAISTR